ncbi:S-adenosyl-L-methionine-dependent methyltransferase-8 [Coleophoma crateriformis]|uniref:S-adenosyl-L-methionine-dependent methyltransferase-8 n=1 Tax=Coleophoma crateriformis TaxID=565419 RepID=A0A3D8QHR8_9HELO|nr:S-adenosyl-L-methionine-dependent methyltransferase-8 [Coleophoma crateriformis]
MADVTQPAPEPAEPILAEADDYDADSAIGTESITSSTTSIAESIYKHRHENGRTYHAYKEGKYILPNDEGENDRLDLQHHLSLLTTGGKLFLCPAGKENKLHRVLDVGTGTGIWAIDFADEHPECEVLGVDLSPIQPKYIPPNLTFQIDDIEEPWNFNYKFDLIYARMMIGSLADWPRFFEQAYENLAPGGFIEMFDDPFPPLNDDNSWPENSALKRWGELILSGCAKFGRPADATYHYEAQLKAAGFINYGKALYKWPTNRWPKDKHLKELGMWTYEDICGGISGISMAIFTRAHGWTADEVEAFLVDVRKEFKDTRIHTYFPV